MKRLREHNGGGDNNDDNGGGGGVGVGVAEKSLDLIRPQLKASMCPTYRGPAISLASLHDTSVGSCPIGGLFQDLWSWHIIPNLEEYPFVRCTLRQVCRTLYELVPWFEEDRQLTKRLVATQKKALYF